MTSNLSAMAAFLCAAVGFGCDDGLVAAVRFEPVTAPEGVDFGLVRPGEEVRRAVTFQNPNSLLLEASLSLEGPGRPSFSAPSQLRLVPGATEVEIVYLPVEVDADHEAVLRVEFPQDPQVSGPSVALLGRVAPSALTLAPLRLDFGAVVVGSTVSASFRVADRTGRASDISLRLEPGSEDFGAPVPALVTGAGGFEVGFVARRRQGSRRATQLLAQSGAGGRARAELFAEVVEVPLRCASPLDLGYLSPGASAEATATCENVSGQTLALGPAVATSSQDPPERSRWSASAAEAEVPAGGSVDVRVSVEALATDEDGRTLEAAVAVPVTVVGQDGLQTRPGRVEALVRVGAPQLSASPTSLDFGRVQLETASSLPVVLENVGRWPVELERVRVVGSDSFSLSPPNLLLPGERVLAEVAFSPSAVGLQTATLEVLAAGALPVEVSLSGEGFDGPPCRDLHAWLELPFGSVYADYNRTLPLRLENRGPSDCVVGPFSGRVPRDVPVEAVDGSQVVLAPGERRDVEFLYRPTEESRLESELSFYVNGTPPVLLVRLTGAGVTWRAVPAYGPADGWRWPAMALPTHLRFHLGPGCASQQGVIDVTEHYTWFWETNSLIDTELQVGDVTIEGPDRAAFVLVGRGPAQPFREPRGRSLVPRRMTGDRLEVAYRPTSPGQHRAWLRVEADGIPDPLTVPLFGDAGPVWVEDVIAPDPPLDVVLTVAPRDEAAADQIRPQDRPGQPWIARPRVLLGSRSDIADGLGSVWEEGVDLQVSTVHSQSPYGTCPFNRAVVSRLRGIPTDADCRFPPADLPEGSCGFFALGSSVAGRSEDFRRIDSNTLPSPEVALRALVQSYPTSLPPGFSAGNTPMIAAATAVGWPLRNTWNEGFSVPVERWPSSP